MEDYEQEKPPLLIDLFDTLSAIVKATIIALAIVFFVAQVTIVQGFSMDPNLQHGQRVLIDKLTVRFDEPARGDVVVIEVQNSDLPLIKRVIALPGETVEIRENTVYVNGEMLSEPYLLNAQHGDYGPLLVPNEHVFVMGDNRSNSRDSRAFGPVDLYRVVGIARASIWPPEEFGVVR